MSEAPRDVPHAERHQGPRDVRHATPRDVPRADAAADVERRRILIAGAAGRLGRVAARAVEDAPDLFLAGAILRGDDALTVLAAHPAAVVLDVTHADVSRVLAPSVVRAGVAVVVGTSGLDARDDAQLDAACRAAGVPALRVPNFSLGAVLQLRACEDMARHLPCLGIHEVHHATKRDTPSGTSLHAAARIATAAARGGRPGPAPPIHSERRDDVLAEQRVLFGGTDDVVCVEHVVRDRQAYAAGILLALRRVQELRPGLHVGLEVVLDLG